MSPSGDEHLDGDATDVALLLPRSRRLDHSVGTERSGPEVRLDADGAVDSNTGRLPPEVRAKDQGGEAKGLLCVFWLHDVPLHRKQSRESTRRGTRLGFTFGVVSRGCVYSEWLPYMINLCFMDGLPRNVPSIFNQFHRTSSR